jgi:hypothetical protein
MRTTIDLPDDLHKIARGIAQKNSSTLSETVAELIRRGLGQNTTKVWLERDPLTGLMVLHGGPPITCEDVKALEEED